MLLAALPTVAGVRLALWLMPSTRVHSLLLRWPGGPRSLRRSTVEELSRAVSRASRLVPQATCLTQALALQLMLRRRGVASRVEIGFLRSEDDRVKGHAWLVCEERVVIGGRSSANFTRSLTLEG